MIVSTRRRLIQMKYRTDQTYNSSGVFHLPSHGNSVETEFGKSGRVTATLDRLALNRNAIA
jgi:hypothetical protein